MEERVILVDENDNQLGVMPKMEAHEKAVLHRAFSVFIFNDKGQLMLQQRAACKYHSPLLWTNTCCSHQREGESNIEAGRRRLQEEMGFTTELKEVFSFIYKAPFDNGLTEHELDHVLIGSFNGNPNLNADEVEDYKWMTLQEVKADMDKNPSIYTAWFKIIFDKSFDKLTHA
ncbi:MAG: isopentenyl-diphosphate Delta-isomerase [Polaribacter sp.]|uniref:isopentenyl-diphosphate Delta-isomerase n=1 Tax=Polaribacter sp. TaxID=1920175 RepID=UPI003BB14786